MYFAPVLVGIAFAACGGGSTTGATPTAVATSTVSASPAMATPSGSPTVAEWDARPVGSIGDWVWVRVFDGVLYASAGPQFKGDNNFFNGPGKVVAIDAATGKDRWSFDTPSQPFPVEVSGGRAMFGTADGTVFALDAGKGTVVWQQAFPGIPFQVIATASAVVVADGDPEAWGPGGIADKTRLNGRVRALDPATGQERWEATVGPFGTFTAAAGDDVVVTSSSYSGSDEAVLLDKDGKRKWATTVTSTTSLPVVGDGAVFVAGSKLQKIDLASGKLLWAVDPGSGGTFVGPMIMGDRVVAATNTNTLEARSVADGSVAGVGKFRDCGFLPIVASPYALACGAVYRIDLTPGGVALTEVRRPQGIYQSADFAQGEIFVGATIGDFGPPSVGHFDPLKQK